MSAIKISLFLFMGCYYSHGHRIRMGRPPNQENITWPEYPDDSILYDEFPPDFKWGFATASYQIEGGWNADGKGVSIWDTFTHQSPSPIHDNSTGDVACDSYNKYARDVEMLKDLGSHFYRFSLSWSRILPFGTTQIINQAGIDYYNQLIDLLIENDIEPMITLYHWDLPQAFQNLGGWPNDVVVEHFANFARLAFDKVKMWITFNEPTVFCYLGYAVGGHAPGIGGWGDGQENATAPYECGHTLLKGHARAYRIYEEEFKGTQNGQVGITISTGWYEPLNASNPEDVASARRAIMFNHGWFGHPIFFGDYPEEMKEGIAKKSAEEGLPSSRLPEFDDEWKNIINGTWDFLGLNYYSTSITRTRDGSWPGWTQDSDVEELKDPRWPQAASGWLYEVPWGLRKLLTWIKEEYGGPDVYVTENGWSDTEVEGVEDDGRVRYFRNNINEMLKAILEHEVPVKGYTAWSLMDNFEWGEGYTERFGVHFVDFEDPERTRTVKKSALFLKQLIEDNGFIEDGQWK